MVRFSEFGYLSTKFAKSSGNVFIMIVVKPTILTFLKPHARKRFEGAIILAAFTQCKSLNE